MMLLCMHKVVIIKILIPELVLYQYFLLGYSKIVLDHVFYVCAHHNAYVQIHELETQYMNKLYKVHIKFVNYAELFLLNRNLTQLSYSFLE